MRASTRSGRLLAALLAGAAVLVAGCSASSPSAAPKVAKKTASAPAAPTPSPTLAAAPCKVVTVLLGHASHTAGTAYYPIVFENLSSTPCTLEGFPTVSFTSINFSAKIGPAATRNPSSFAQLVTLEPEGTAKALIAVVNANNYSSSCGQTAVGGILVQPPSLTNLVRLPFTGLTCVNPRYHVLTVDAVALGPPLLDAS